MVTVIDSITGELLDYNIVPVAGGFDISHAGYHTIYITDAEYNSGVTVAMQRNDLLPEVIVRPKKNKVSDLVFFALLSFVISKLIK